MSTFIVTHPRLYLKTDIDGKLKMVHAVEGSEVELTNSEAKSLIAKKRLVLKVAKQPKVAQKEDKKTTEKGKK